MQNTPQVMHPTCMGDLQTLPHQLQGTAIPWIVTPTPRLNNNDINRTKCNWNHQTVLWKCDDNSGSGPPTPTVDRDTKNAPNHPLQGAKNPMENASHRCKIDTRLKDAPWDSPRFQGLYWGPRQSGHGGPEAMEPLAAPLWEVPGLKQCTAAMQCCHHGNHTHTQCRHQWCTLLPHHMCMKGPGNVHKCAMPSRCM